MRKKHFVPRFLAMFLALVLTVSSMPLNVLATESTATDVVEAIETVVEEIEAESQAEEQNVVETEAAVETETVVEASETESVDEVESAVQTEEESPETLPVETESVEVTETEVTAETEVTTEEVTEETVEETEELLEVVEVVYNEENPYEFEAKDGSISKSQLYAYLVDAFADDSFSGYLFGDIKVDKLLNSIGTVSVTDGEIYEVKSTTITGGSTLVGYVKAKVYYEVNIKFQTMPAEGGITLAGNFYNNDAEAVKVYAAGGAPEFAVKQVDGYLAKVTLNDQEVTSPIEGMTSGELKVAYLESPATVTVAADDTKGTVTVAGEIVANGASAKVEEGIVVIKVTPAKGYNVGSIKVGKLNPIVEYADGSAFFELEVESDKEYTVTVEFVESIFKYTKEYSENQAINFSYGQSSNAPADIYKQIVAAPKLNDESEVKVSYLARKEGKFVLDLSAYQAVISSLPASVEIPLPDLWLDTNAELNEITEEELIAKIVNDPGLLLNLDTFKNMHVDVHAFGELGEGSEETVKISYKDNKVSVETQEALTVKITDNRKTSAIEANAVELEYGFTAEELIAATGAKVVDANGKEIAGTVVVDTELSTLNASSTPYEVNLFYAGDAKYRQCTATVSVKVRKAHVDLTYDTQIVTYGEDYELAIEKSADADVIEFVLGVDGADGAKGYAAISLPGVLGKLIKGSYDLSKLTDLLGKVAEWDPAVFEGTGFDPATATLIADAITKILSNLELPSVIIHITDEVEPKNIGIYVAGAVTADINYDLAFAMNALLVTPQLNKAELGWNMQDENSVITTDYLEVFDFGASVLSVEGGDIAAAAEKLTYIYLGAEIDFTEEGKITGDLLIDRTTDANIIDALGVYTQVAYLNDFSIDNQIYYAVPLVRALAVSPSNVDIVFNGENTFAYDGSNHGLDVSVVKKDGTAADLSKLDVTYIGYDKNDVAIYNSKTAPVNAGVYSVFAVYKDFEAESYGMNVATLTIEAADVDVTVDSLVIPENAVFNAGSAIKVDPADCKTVNLLVGLDTNGNYSSLNVNGITTVMNIDLPARIDNALKAALDSAAAFGSVGAQAAEWMKNAYANGVTVSSLREEIAMLQDILEVYGGNGEVVAYINNVLTKVAPLTDDTRVTFFDMDGYVLGTGVYMLGAVTCDPNYKVDADFGLLIASDAISGVELAFDQIIPHPLNWIEYGDEFNYGVNGRIYLSNDENEVGTEIPAERINQFFFGMDEENSFYVSRTAPVDLGDYKQLAFTAFAENGKAYISAPLDRDFTIVSEITPVEISEIAFTLTDENGAELNADFGMKFTGFEVAPAVVCGNEALIEGVHYTIGYENNVEPGENTAAAVVTGLEPYFTGTLNLPFTITVVDLALADKETEIIEGEIDGEIRIDLNDTDIESVSSLYIADQTFTGKAIKPVISVYHGTTKLVQNKDYTVTYKNNKNVFNIGEEGYTNVKKIPTVIVKGKGNYTGTQTVHFSILKKGIEDLKVTYTDSYVVSKKNIGVALKLMYDKITLKKNTDYVVEFVNAEGTVSSAIGKETGAYTMKVTGKGNYEGVIELPVTLVDAKEEKAVSKLAVTAKATNAGTAPVIIVKDGKTVLTEGVHYEVIFDSNNDGVADFNNTGKQTAVIKGLDQGDINYVGTKKVTYTVNGGSISKATVSGEWKASVVYNGTAQVQNIENLVLKNGDVLTEGIDYTVVYKNNTNVGTAAVTFTGIGSYKGTLKKSFKITAQPVSVDKVTLEEGFVLNKEENVEFTKAGAKAAITGFTFNGTNLTAGKDYTVSYKNNKKVGTATLTVKGIKNFKGVYSTTFQVVPQDINELTLVLPNVLASKKKGNFKSVPVIYDNQNKTLANGKDYKVSYWIADETAENGRRQLTSKDNVAVDTEIIVVIEGVEAKGFGGVREKVITVEPKKIASVKVKVKYAPLTKGFWYTGEEITLEGSDLNIEYKVKGQLPEKLELGTDYEIIEGTYRNNVKKGTATVQIQGIGDYSGKKTVSFKIVARPTWLDIFNRVDDLFTPDAE